MKRSAVVAAVLSGGVAVLACLSPAPADDAATIYKKITAATNAQTSFQMTLTMAAMGMTTVATVVRPASSAGGMSPGSTAMAPTGAMKASTAAAAMTMDVYLVNGALYMSINGGKWQKRSVDPETLKAQLSSIISQGGETPTLTLEPDRTSGAFTFGAIRIVTATPKSLAAMPGASGTTTLECTYDKASYLLHECDTDQLSIVYEKYNDPSNVVTLPPDAANATELPPLTLPATASPAPSAAPK